jgi:hypothetical protein
VTTFLLDADSWGLHSSYFLGAGGGVGGLVGGSSSSKKQAQEQWATISQVTSVILVVRPDRTRTQHQQTACNIA